MKETHKPKSRKEPAESQPCSQSRPKKNAVQKSGEKPKNSKKQTVISEKNVVRNPKHSPQRVVEVVTKPKGHHEDSLRNQKNSVNQEVLVQTGNNPTMLG